MNAAPPRNGNTTALWALFAIACLSFLPTLWLEYVGEEGVYTITSLEMWYHGHYLEPHLYGGAYGRPPLLNWAIIPVAELLGWGNMLVASRLVTALSTIATGLLLAWLAQRLFRDRVLTALAALVYLTSDALLYHGWLAYSDPLFSLLTFGAIACLWVASEEERHDLLLLGLLCVSAAFLTKALTTYVFYGVALAVLLWRHPAQRRFLLGAPSVLLHLLTFAGPLVWYARIPGGSGQGHGMLHDVLAKLAADRFFPYLWQIVEFPLETLARFLPAAPVALWLLARKKYRPTAAGGGRLATGLWILGLNYLPYWLSPQSSIRYIMPLYPLFALAIAQVIRSSDQGGLRLAARWLAGVIVFKLVAALWLFPYYQAHFRGDYGAVARDIAARTAGQPLYAADVSATGLSVTARLDTARLPRPPLTFPPAQWHTGFVIAYTPDPALGRLTREYRLGGSRLYLLCRGKACGTAAR